MGSSVVVVPAPQTAALDQSYWRKSQSGMLVGKSEHLALTLVQAPPDAPKSKACLTNWAPPQEARWSVSGLPAWVVPLAPARGVELDPESLLAPLYRTRELELGILRVHKGTPDWPSAFLARVP